MNTAELLDKVKSTHEAWEQVLSEVGEERMLEPGVDGDWSVKDVIAHVVWHEREMVKLMRNRGWPDDDTEEDLWNLPLHERNAAIFEKNHNRSLDDVLADSSQTYSEVLQELGQLTDTDLVDPGRFPPMPPDWVPWEIIAQNTYEHYEDHTRDLRNWLSP